MELSDALLRELRALTDALDQPPIDLEDLLRRLAQSAQAAVDSMLGVSLRISTEPEPVMVLVQDLHRPIRASVAVSLADLCSTGVQGAIVFYAAVEGALTDLAADLQFALGLAPDALGVDVDLRWPDGSRGTGLSELSQLNQAIGILIETGHTVEEATAELTKLAGLAGLSLLAMARLLIEQTAGG